MATESNVIATFSSGLCRVTPEFDKLNGRVYPATEPVDRSSGPILSAKRARAFFLPLVSAGMNGDFPLPPGLTVISGATAVGKSSFLRDVANSFGSHEGHDRLVRLSAVEPFDDPADIGEWYLDADDALAAAVASQMADDRVLPAIDSLRSVLFEMSGAATSKGMTARFFTQLTRVSNALASNGRTVLATVNPMNSETDFVTEFLGRLAAALPALIVLERRDGPGQYRGYTVSRDPVTARRQVPFVMGGRGPAVVTPSVEYDFAASDSFAVMPFAAVNAIRSNA